MAYIQDSTQTFTITLTALLEGLGIITRIDVYNATSTITHTWTLATGTWDPSPPEAIEGDSITAIPMITNQGDVADYMWIEMSSVQLWTTNPFAESPDLIDVGLGFGMFRVFTMPPKNVSITINAGHIE